MRSEPVGEPVTVRSAIANLFSATYGLFIVLSLVIGGADTFSLPPSISAPIAAAGCLAVGLRTSSTRLEVGAGGVRVHNFWGSHALRWEEIDAIMPSIVVGHFTTCVAFLYPTARRKRIARSRASIFLPRGKREALERLLSAYAQHHAVDFDLCLSPNGTWAAISAS